MKICFIHNLYAPYARGGAEKVVVRAATAALAEGHDAFIITSAPQKDVKNIDGVKVYYLKTGYYNLSRYPLPLRLIWHFFNVYNLSVYRECKNIFDSEKPNLIVSNNLLGLGYLVWLAASKKGIRLIHILHDVQMLYPSGLIYLDTVKNIDSLSAKMWQCLTKKFTKQVGFVASPSKWLLEWHLARGFFKGAKNSVIANPVPKFSSIKRQTKTDGKINLLYVGQLEKHKGVDVLLDAYEILLKESPDKYKLTIAGAGSLENRISSGKSINFLGNLSTKEVSQAMSESDLLIVPSICYENSPLVISEAFSVGLPVIGSRLGGIAEVLDDDCLFIPGDALDLAKTIRRSTENSQAPQAKNYIRTEKDYLNDLLSFAGLEKS